MSWLDIEVDKVLEAFPNGEIVVSSGVSPSGKYHVGTLREVLTADALYRGIKKRGRTVRHVHFADDLDPLRKVPAGVPPEYEKYFGKSLCDIPAPDGSDQSYADYYLSDFTDNTAVLGIEMEVVRSYKKYRAGYFVPAIEKVLSNIDVVRQSLESISGRKLEEAWSPIQINEEGYLKKRQFKMLDIAAKTLTYLDKDGYEQSIRYDVGQVKLDWRLDWPARWWLVGVNVEPFGRDHATKGGSYDTGQELARKVFDSQPPLPVPYDFINRAGETKKMSKSAGNTVTVTELLSVLPPEIVRFFVLRYPPHKQLFFDQTDGVIRLIDEYAALLAKTGKSADEEQLLSISMGGSSERTISNVPFSHLVASYQASLRNMEKTLEVISRTEHADMAGEQAEIIKRELSYIDSWLETWARDDIKFELQKELELTEFSEQEQAFLKKLGEKVAAAPDGADGNYFHERIYELKEQTGLEPKEMFSVLYRALIGKSSGPRAGWFLSILPREWLVKRLKLEG